MRRANNRRQRDTIDIASPLLERAQLRQSTTLADLGSLLERSYLQEIEDNREFHPLREDRPAGARRRSDRMFTDATRLFGGRTQIGFARPQGVAVCVRRKTRREVLHALKRTRGGAGAKKRTYNWKSFVKC